MLLTGKSTISMAIFNSFLYVYQRVSFMNLSVQICSILCHFPKHLWKKWGNSSSISDGRKPLHNPTPKPSEMRTDRKPILVWFTLPWNLKKNVFKLFLYMVLIQKIGDIWYGPYSLQWSMRFWGTILFSEKPTLDPTNKHLRFHHEKCGEI